MQAINSIMMQVRSYQVSKVLDSVSRISVDMPSVRMYLICASTLLYSIYSYYSFNWLLLLMYTYYTDPPSVSIQTTLLQMKIGSQFNLTCQFDGNPTPNITWLINGSPLDTSQSHLSVSVSGNLALLQISNSVLRDIGYYSCRGNNWIGSPATSEAVYLIVQGAYTRT